MVIYIGQPTSQQIHYLAEHSVISLITYSMSKLSGVDIIYQPQEGVRTDRNRNILLEEAYKVNFDYMLWLDSDMRFPADMLVKYLEAKKAVDWDIIGCLYFKGKPPYEPIGYHTKNPENGKYKALHPDSVLPTDIIPVVALGYGGMMVSRKVYDSMGDDKWVRYGSNFHLPQPQPKEYQTHDFWFCEKAIEHGAKIYLHGGVRPTHIKMVEIGYDDWKRESLKPKYDETVTVIMPTIKPDLAVKTAKILKTRAGIEANYRVIEDIKKAGYVKTINNELKNINSRYVVYLTDDIFPSRNWLKNSFNLMIEKGAGLIGYNDGKWEGSLATCGLVDRTWSDSLYNGNLFFPRYFGHYNDTEITLHGFSQHKYFYDPNISLIEVDYDKEAKKVHIKDRELFNRRKKSKFDNKIVNDQLINMFG